MRCASAADFKKKHNVQKDPLPREGTRIRKVYDLFYKNKGAILRFTLKELGVEKGGVHYLVDFYGLDIRNFGYGKWCLVGEWVGKTYIDYLTSKVKK